MTATDNPQLQRRWLPWVPKAITRSQGGEIFFQGPGAQKLGQVGVCPESKQSGTGGGGGGGGGRPPGEEKPALEPWPRELAFQAGRWPAQAWVWLWLQC